MADSVVLCFVQEHEDGSENADQFEEGKLHPMKDKLRKSRSFGNIMSVGARVDPNSSQERTHSHVQEAIPQPSTPEYSLHSIHYSPSHSTLTKCDKYASMSRQIAICLTIFMMNKCGWWIWGPQGAPSNRLDLLGKKEVETLYVPSCGER